MGYLDQMQQEFVRHYPSLPIELIGINEARYESANETATQGKDIPWLQDVDEDGNDVSDVWYDSWQVTYRDVVIVDRQLNQIGVYNLTEHNLGEEAKYAALKQLLIDAAKTDPATPWQSPVEPLDVNADGFVAPLDALLVINDLGRYANGQLPESAANQAPFLDPSGDGILSPVDALRVINHLTYVSSLDAPQAALSAQTALPQPSPGPADPLPVARPLPVAAEHAAPAGQQEIWAAERIDAVMSDGGEELSPPWVGAVSPLAEVAGDEGLMQGGSRAQGASSTATLDKTMSLL